jgi:3-isopropylmalate/(R)-2-methylmalate dehydratase large subunit
VWGSVFPLPFLLPGTELSLAGPVAGVNRKETEVMGQTLAAKIWNRHVVHQQNGSPDLLYIDLHLVNEVTSPQAFDGLRSADRTVRRPDLTLAMEDHNVPTIGVDQPIADPVSALQVETLRRNCSEFGIELFKMGAEDQGIVHVVGPQLGLTHPGMTIVCGDSHTSTHGAFGALAFGIGTSEAEHVLATQTLPAAPFKTMAVNFEGELPAGSSAKDVILALIAQIGTGGGQGYVLEYRGSAIRKMSMEARMTLCNMSIEAGARAGIIVPDQTTLDYLYGRPKAPHGEAWDEAAAHWLSLATDADAVFDAEVTLDVGAVTPYVTWGTNPGQGVPISGSIPHPEEVTDPRARTAAERALSYMGLEAGTPMKSVAVDTVFLGSCTNGRIEDLRLAATILSGHRIKPGMRMLVVPGSMKVKVQAEEEGLDRVFLDAGAEWRFSGCSMCLGMNPDQVEPGQRCVSTSNRNFEGRQGRGSRTHLVSPAVAAATAIRGTISAPSDLN